jgi:hypothetical protein
MDNWYSVPGDTVHTSTCHLAMVGARLVTKGVGWECANAEGQIYVSAEMKATYAVTSKDLVKFHLRAHRISGTPSPPHSCLVRTVFGYPTNKRVFRGIIAWGIANEGKRLKARWMEESGGEAS